MVTGELEPEVLRALEYIQKRENFLLSGGAGSGKTYSLIQIIKEVFTYFPTKNIACITYTNAATDEIKKRIDRERLHVSTIHDFLWEMIKPFQKEMKLMIINLINTENKYFKNPNGDHTEYNNEFENGIQYKEYLSLNNGVICHEQLITLAYFMFEKYSKLRNIVASIFPYIFVDEYQDTSPLVIKILIDLLGKAVKKPVIGLFGDSMQAIYEDGIGDVNEYIYGDIIKEIQKEQNRRNPKLIIDFANILRTDNLIQKVSNDKKAPNMVDGKIKLGKIKFLYSEIENLDFKIIRESEYCKDWNFKDSKITKELRLTNNLISKEAGFDDLMKIYNKDPIIELKTVIKKRIKEREIIIDESKSFEEIVLKANWEYKSGNNIGKTPKEVLISDEEKIKLYNFIKNWSYKKVSKIYFDKDNLIGDKKEIIGAKVETKNKRDDLIKHLFKIQEIIELYKIGNYNELIKKTDFKIRKTEDKIKLKENIERLKDNELSIEEVIKIADEFKLCVIDDKIKKFQKEKEYLYYRMKEVKFSVFKNLYDYLEGYTPYSTQHKIKGLEFDNVLIFLSNGDWDKYNFYYLFNNESEVELPPTKKKTFPKILLRTKKLFYVCCTRSKDNLVLFYPKANEKVLNCAIEWFGKENVHKIEKPQNVII